VLWYFYGHRERAKRTVVEEEPLEEKLITSSGRFTH